MGTTQSSVQRCLVVLRVNDNSRCFPRLSPFVHAIIKYNTTPIQSEDDIKKMAAQRYLDLEILDLINRTTKNISVATPLGIGVKFCVPRLLELKVLEVEQGSPAEKRIVEGDFVVGIENFYFETNDEFFYAIYRNRGTVLNFIVYREGQVRRVPIKLNTCEPFLGAVFGEGILMTAGRSGDVVNIGTQSEYQLDIGSAAFEDTGEMQQNTEKTANSKLQVAGSEAPGDSNVKHNQENNCKAECTEEQVHGTKKESNTGAGLNMTGESIQEASPLNNSDVAYNMEDEPLFSGAHNGQDVSDTSCGRESFHSDMPIGEAFCSEQADAACNAEVHENYLSESKDNEFSSVLGVQQSGSSMEHTESQQDTFGDSNKVSSGHGHAGSEATSLGPNQFITAYSPSNLETTPEENTHTCPIIGEYSNEDKIRLLETLTGAKKENMSEPE